MQAETVVRAAPPRILSEALFFEEPVPHSPFGAAPPVGSPLSVALNDYVVYVNRMHEVN